jgi:hypothetical protein
MRVRRETVIGAAALAFAGFITISCGGVNEPSNNTVTTLTLTVQARGGQSNLATFPVSNTGEYSVKVTGSNPTFSSQFLLTVGIGDASSCGTLLQSLTSVNGVALGGAVVQKGTYCVYVNDIGNTFTQAPITFTVQASHP